MMVRQTVEQRLNNILIKLRGMGFEQEVPAVAIRNAIRLLYGSSFKTVNDYMNALIELGYIKPLRAGIYAILKEVKA